MTGMHLLQVGAALVAAGTPWYVARIALRVASRHAKSVRSPFPTPRAVARLRRATLWALPLVAAPALSLQPPSLLMAAIDAVSFIALSILGLRALSEIHEGSRPACEVDLTARHATLRPRRLSEYLAWPWRLLPFAATAVGLALFAWRLARPQPDRRLLMPVAFACFAVVFLWLYETWMRSEVSGGHSADISEGQARRRRQLRMIFTVELAMISCCIGIAHTLLDLDWLVNGAWGATLVLAGAGLGVVGCSLALSSDLNRRRYRLVPPEPRA